MARLTQAQRNRIPKSKFAGKDERFPIDTKKRVRSARTFERYATPAEKKKIDAAARRDGIGSARKTTSRRKSK